MGCNFSSWRWRLTLIKDSLCLSSMETCARVPSTVIPALALLCHWYPVLFKSKWRHINFKIIQSDPPSNLCLPPVSTFGWNPPPIKAFCGKFNLHAHPSKRRRGTTSRPLSISHTCIASLLHSQRDQSLARSTMPRGYSKGWWYPRGHCAHSHR